MFSLLGPMLLPKKTIHYSYTVLINGIQLQTTIFLVSLPILIMWGIPLSVMAPVGNIIFTPFITVFLALCCVTFIAYLCYLPITGFLYALEHITEQWLGLLSSGDNGWLIGFAYPGPLVLCAIPLGTFLILALYLRPAVKTVFLIGYSGIICWYLSMIRTGIDHAPVARNNEIVHCLTIDHKKIVIDPGTTMLPAHHDSWVRYQFVAEMYKKYGSIMIDTIILLSSSRSSMHMMHSYCKHLNVKNIMVPPHSITVLDCLESGEVSQLPLIKHVYERTFVTDCHEKNTVVLRPETAYVNQYHRSPGYLVAEVQIDNKPFTLYAAKHRKTNIKGLS